MSPADSKTFELRLPQFGMGMNDATISRWLKNEGDSVVEGEILCEVETAKATAEVECPTNGVLLKIVVAAQNSAEVRDVIAVIGIGDAGAATGKQASAGGSDRSDSAAAGASNVAAAAAGSTEHNSHRAATAHGESNAATQGASTAPSASRRASVQIEPRARRAAEKLGVDLNAVQGSGPEGRITEADVERVATVRSAADTGFATEPSSEFAEYDEIPHTRMRKLIAERVTHSKQAVPHFYLTVHCEIDKLLELRQQKNDASRGLNLTINDFLIKAVATAMRKVPAVNIGWTATAMRHYHQVHLSIAVATDAGLVTPTLRNADIKTIQEISAEVKALAARAHDGKLKPEDHEGGQLTLSNLGMFGIPEFTAIINEPQACILAVGAGERRPVVRNGKLEIATLMTCTLSVDHRAIDGAVAAEFLSAIKTAIERPHSPLP